MIDRIISSLWLIVYILETFFKIIIKCTLSYIIVPRFFFLQNEDKRSKRESNYFNFFGIDRQNRWYYYEGVRQLEQKLKEAIGEVLYLEKDWGGVGQHMALNSDYPHCPQPEFNHKLPGAFVINGGQLQVKLTKVFYILIFSYRIN